MKIDPLQKTTGVVSRNNSQLIGIGEGIWLPMIAAPTGEYRKIGMDNRNAIQNRRRMSASISLAICGFVIAASWFMWLIFDMS